MIQKFKKLMREQVQETVNGFLHLTSNSMPKSGWIRTIRDALGMSSNVLAKKLGCRSANIISIEQREKKGTIKLETLEQVASAMNCKLVYCLVPLEPLDVMLEKRARLIAKKRIELVNRSMSLEQQGLNFKQLQQQEEKLVQELLHGDPKKLWNNDEV